MSDHMRKALRSAGKIDITIRGEYDGNIKYSVHESAYRLDGFQRGEITKEMLEAAEDPDGLIRDVVSEVVRKNHIAWEARQE